jgi:uncharacterized membrane protein YjjP (DUF1212 family)
MVTASSQPNPGNQAAGPSAREALDLLLTLARALHAAGLPSHRLEETLLQAAKRLGVSLVVFSLPTGILVCFQEDGRPATFVLRLQPGSANLERLAQLTAVAGELLRGQVSVADARARIDRIVSAPPRWRWPFIVVAYVFSAAAFAVFFHGGLAEVEVATCIGLAVGLIAVATQKARVSGRVFELASAAAAALIAAGMEAMLGDFVEWIPLAAGLIILLPGLSMVDAVEELANGHLASGASRLAGVGVAFLALTFGAVLGFKTADLLRLGPNPPTDLAELPGWVVLPALLLVAVGSTIRFRARPRDAGIILVASALALGGSRLGTWLFDSPTGPFLGALVLGLAANLYARFRRQAAELWLTPGLALLVPGSVGVQSVSALTSQDTLKGIDAAFQMFLIAMALAAGLLFSNSLLRERPPA